MRDGFRILDADRHVIEPIEMWQDYLPAALRQYAPQLTPLAPIGESLDSRLTRLGEYALLPVPQILAVAGKPLLRGVSETMYIETGLLAERRRGQLTDAQTPAGQLAAMDHTGVDVALLLPTFAPYLIYDDEIDASRSRGFAQAYNRWLRDFCATNPARLVAAAIISRHDPSAMVGDLELAIRDGFQRIVLRPNPVLGRVLGTAEYAPFWRACAHHDITVLLHEGTHTPVRTAGADRFISQFGKHACSHPLEAMMALLSLIEGGVLEQNPTLRFGFLESGCGWLPYWLWRLDEVEYPQHAQELRHRVRRRPSEYFHRQCWIALEPTEAMLPHIVSELGASRLLFGSDFPHLDHNSAIVAELFNEPRRLGTAELRTILWDSPCRLLGISSGKP